MLPSHAKDSFAPVCFGAKEAGQVALVIIFMKNQTLWADVSALVSERLFPPRVESDDPHRQNIIF
jgi:hypothetical protein